MTNYVHMEVCFETYHSAHKDCLERVSLNIGIRARIPCIIGGVVCQ